MRHKANQLVGKKSSRRLVIVGGFLGAGKTSCVGALVEWANSRGLRSALITNDQGNGLVDTLIGQSHIVDSGVDPVREITGGCFCCKLPELVDVLKDLDSKVAPDLFVAEPVGSCTDLVATVLLPLKEVYNSELVLAPMSVVVDGIRAASVLALGGSKSGSAAGFSKEVNYIYLKQLEECEIIVLNKIDLLSAKQLRALREELERNFPKKQIIQVSARTGEGLEDWFSALLESTSRAIALPEIDYDLYAHGEEMLGWYNADLSVHAVGNDFNGSRLLLGVANEIQRKLEQANIEIAHFKMSLHAGGIKSDQIAVVSAVRNNSKPSLSGSINDKLVTAQFRVNLRAEGNPELLKRIVQGEIDKERPEVRFIWRDEAAFRPGRPQPVHRIEALSTP